MAVNTLPSVSSLSNMGILNNEILTSYDWYHFDGPHMNTFPGKFYQQDLHHWYHSHNYAKWYYWKDPNNGDWWGFYNALHNPPSEKIVDMYYNYWWGGQWQLWAYIKRYNRT